jgi:hypothetical protein
LLPDWFDKDNAVATSNYQAEWKVKDSLGITHALNVYLRKDNENQWSWYVLTDGGAVVGGTPGVSTNVGSGYIYFNSLGHYSWGGGSVTVHFTGAESQSISIDGSNLTQIQGASDAFLRSH